MLYQFDLDKKLEEFLDRLEREQPILKLERNPVKNDLMTLLNAEYQGQASDVEAFLQRIQQASNHPTSA